MSTRNFLLLLIAWFFTINVEAQADTVLSRYRQFLLRSATPAFLAENWSETMDAEGKWPDLDYSNRAMGNWRPLQHVIRLRAMAFAYGHPKSKRFQDQTLLAKINLGLDHWYEKRYKCPNWWHNEIGVPQQMRDLLVMLGPVLVPVQRTKALEILAQFKIQPSGQGANLVWSADLALHYALLVGDEALARRCSDLLTTEIQITTGDGVQPDYSFHQHDKRLQMYQYGGAFLRENVRLAWELRGTRLAFPPIKIDLLTDFVLKGWQVMARGIHTVPGTMDRSASRKDAMNSADIRALIPYLIELVPSQTMAWKALQQQQNDRASLNGYWYFPYSDFSAYHQQEFSFFLKTISSRTLATESINSENLLGRLLNSGDAYLIHDGNEYFNLMPVWDWEKLPGVTSFEGADHIKRQPFNGSVSDDMAGFTSMDYRLENKDGTRYISARKSWFFYEGKVICLIGNLQGKNVEQAYTTLDQARWRERVYSNLSNKALDKGRHELKNVKWLYQAPFAYASLQPASIELKLDEVVGSWTRINLNESADQISEKIFLPVLTHRLESVPQSAAYYFTSARNKRSWKKAARNPGVRILQNDSLVQAVAFPDNTRMYSFFGTGVHSEGNSRIETNKPCVFMIKGGTLYVSDPLQTGQTVMITINGRAYTCPISKEGFTTGFPLQENP